MSVKRTLLNASALSGALVIGATSPALADCTIENPAAGQTTVCNGPLTKSYLFDNSAITVQATGTQSLAAPIALYRAPGSDVSVQVADGAELTNTHAAGQVVIIGGKGSLDNGGALTSSHTAVTMGAEASFLNRGTIVADSRSGAAAVVIGADARSFENKGTIRNYGVGVQIGAGSSRITNDGLIETTGDNSPFYHALAIDAGLILNRLVINTGTIRTRGESADGVHVTGVANVTNRGTIEVTGAGSAAIRGGDRSSVYNDDDGWISSKAGPAVVLGHRASVSNGGSMLSNAGTALSLGDSSKLDNRGLIAGGNNAVTFGATGELYNRVGGQILGNSAVAPTVVMNSGSNLLSNAGLIDGANLDPGGSIVLFSASAGGLSQLTNFASGVIGNADDAAVLNAVATRIGSGGIVVENLGTIHGTLDLSEAEGSAIHNGVLSNASPSNGATGALINGHVRFGEGADRLQNNGELKGNVSFGDGDDQGLNHEGAVITGNMDFGLGADTFEQFGATIGDVSMGEGDDRLVLVGSISGFIDMGDGDDVLEVREAHIFDAASPVQGSSGTDTLVLTGTMDVLAEHFTGFEKLRKNSSGAAVLKGNWTFSEGMLFEGGLLTLDADASLKGGLATVQGEYNLAGLHDGDILVDGGMLFGRGRVGYGDPGRILTNAGSVAPGDWYEPTGALGVLTINGDYVQTSAGTLIINLGAAEGAPLQNDVLSVSGLATLAGTVRFVPNDLALIDKDYVFLTAVGGVVGQFQNVQGVGLFYNYSVSYASANQVSVRLSDSTTPPPPPPPPPMLEVINGLTRNQNAVRDAFISRGAFSSDLALVRAELNDIDPSRAAAALDTLSGEIYAATPAITVETHGRFVEGLRARSSTLRDPYALEQAGGWARGYGRRADVESDRSYAGYQTGTAGLAVGADKALGSALRVGVALGAAEARVEQDRTRSRAEIRSLEVGGYAAFDSGKAWLDASVSYGAHDLEVSRMLTTGVSAQRRAAGETEASSWRAEVVVGTRLPYGDVLVTPFAGLAFETVSQDGLRETGAADAGLVVAEGDYQATHARFGVQMSRMAIVGNGVELTFGGHVGIGGDIAHDDRTADARLIGGGGVFEVKAAEPGELETFGGASVSARLSHGWSMYGAYDLAGRSGAKSHALSIGLRLAW